MRWPLRGCEGVFRRLLDKLQPAPDKKKHRLVMDPAIGSSVWDRGVVQMYGQALAAVPAYPVAEPRGKQLHATTRPRAHRFACDAERHITSSHGLTDRRCIPSLSGARGAGVLAVVACAAKRRCRQGHTWAASAAVSTAHPCSSSVRRAAGLFTALLGAENGGM